MGVVGGVNCTSARRKRSGKNLCLLSLRGGLSKSNITADTELAVMNCYTRLRILFHIFLLISKISENDALS